MIARDVVDGHNLRQHFRRSWNVVEGGAARIAWK
jgi:hypothetical protein